MLVTPPAGLPLPQRRTRRPAAVRRRRPGVDPPPVRRLARLHRAPQPPSPDTRDETDPERATQAARARRERQQAPPPAPPIREQPPEALARAVDVHHRPRRDTHEQRRRARAPRTGHPPQALSRQPIRRRRTLHRTLPLRLRHLPPATPLATRLPARPTHRPPNRRRAPRPPLNHAPWNQGTERLRIFLFLRACSQIGPLFQFALQSES